MIANYSKSEKRPAGAHPPSAGFVKTLTKITYDLTKRNLVAVIAEAKAKFRGLKFLGAYADCWTSRRGKGFVGIEITFVYFDETTGEIRIVSMCLACVYLKGSHSGARLAELIIKASSYLIRRPCARAFQRLELFG
jgi:hypothetical protein